MKPHLCHVFPTFGTGGPEVRTALLINASADTFRHTVVSLNGDVSCQARLHNPADVTVISAPRPGGRISHYYDLFKRVLSLRADLLLTYAWGGTDAALAAWACGFRRVIHAEDGFSPEEAHGQRFERLLFRRAVLRTPARVVCPSRTLVRIAARDWCLPSQRISYIPNGVDTRRFTPGDREARAAARRRFGLAPTERILGSVGQLRPEKNHERLVRAFAASAAKLPARLLLVGDGPLRGHLEQTARALGVAGRVVFAGAVRDPVECYRAMDLFALTSDTEQMPIALLEAMSMGLPVVSTNVGDVATMLSADNRHYVVPCEREDVLAAALAGLLDDSEGCRVLGQANQAKCRAEYELNGMIRAYVTLYREVLDGVPGFLRRGATPEGSPGLQRRVACVA